MPTLNELEARIQALEARVNTTLLPGRLLAEEATSGLLPFASYSSLPNSISANATAFIATPVPPLRLLRWTQTFRVLTPNNSTNYWLLRLSKSLPDGTAEPLAEFPTSSYGISNWSRVTVNLSKHLVSAAYSMLLLNAVIQGVPGNLSLSAPSVYFIPQA